MKKLIAVTIVVVFSVQLLPGGMLTPPAARAYDVAEDQGHSGGVMLPPKGTTSKAPCPAKGSPVNVKTGEFSYRQQDLLIPGRGVPLQVLRSYNSHEVYNGPFGYGWGFNLEVRLVVTFSGPQEMATIRRGDGVRLEFMRNADGSYSPPQGRLDQLVRDADGGYTWTQGRCSGGCGLPRHRFDAAGYLLAIEDPNGNRSTFSYDGSGKLKKVTDAVGRSLSIAYGGNSKIASIVDPAGRTFSYGYSGSGDLVTVTDPMGRTTTFSYDGGHHLTAVIDPRGNTVTAVSYDALDRAVTVTEAGVAWTYDYSYPASDYLPYTTKALPGASGYWTFWHNTTGQLAQKRDPLYYYTVYSYNDKIELTAVADARGYKRTFEYDDRGNRTAITDPLGNRITLTYHPTLNEVTGITDPLGRTTGYAYDDRGNLITITDALGNQTTFTYDGFGQMTQATNALGFTTSFTYDAYGNLKTTTDALGNVTTLTHDILGRITKVKDARGKSASLAYDPLGNLTTFTDPLGNTTTFAYDKNSNLVTVTDTYGKNTRYEYDAYNRVTKVTDALGNTTTWSYDLRGNVAGETDANGNITTYGYDLVNRLLKKTFADGSSVTFTYDGNGNLTRLTDARGNPTTHEFDALNRLTRVTHADGTRETFTYDKAGNRVTATDRKGNTISFEYDSLNRPISRTYPDGTKVTFRYDALGRVTSAAGPGGTVGYTYDKLGRVVKEVQDGQAVTSRYDPVGNITRLTYPDGSYLTYVYDAMNQLDKIKNPAGAVVADFNYDKLSRRTKLTLMNGNEVTYKFDALSRLTGLTNRKSAAGAVLSSFTYAYDKTYNIQSMMTEVGAHSYTYDKTYQLTQVSTPDGGSTAYQFDAQGNRTTTVNGGTTQYTSNNMNQYTDVGGTPFAYDANGNLLSDGTNTYAYDYENRLVQVVTPSGTVEYSYDAWGRKLSRSDGSSTVRYVYDGDRVIMERNGSGAVLAKYVYGVGLDEALRMDRGAGTHYFLHDALGSVVNATDGSGAKVESYGYDVYGRATIKNKSGATIEKSAIGNPYLFTGRDFDEDSGLYSLRARWYDPVTGRFISPDPIGLEGGDVNLYRYVLNNPASYSDPYGEWFIPVAVILISSIAGYYSSGRTYRGAATGGVIGAGSLYLGTLMAGTRLAASLWGAIASGMFLGAATDIASQTLVQGRSINCLDYYELGTATAISGATAGIFRPAAPVKGAPPVPPAPTATAPAMTRAEMQMFESTKRWAEGFLRDQAKDPGKLIKFLSDLTKEPWGPEVISRVERLISNTMIINGPKMTPHEFAAFQSLKKTLGMFITGGQ